MPGKIRLPERINLVLCNDAILESRENRYYLEFKELCKSAEEKKHARLNGGVTGKMIPGNRSLNHTSYEHFLSGHIPGYNPSLPLGFYSIYNLNHAESSILLPVSGEIGHMALPGSSVGGLVLPCDPENPGTSSLCNPVERLSGMVNYFSSLKKYGFIGEGNFSIAMSSRTYSLISTITEGIITYTSMGEGKGKNPNSSYKLVVHSRLSL